MTLPVGMGINPSVVGPADLHRSAVRQGDMLRPAVRRRRGRHGRDQDPAAPGRLADRRCRLRRPAERPATLGDEYRIFVDAEFSSVSVKLFGRVGADPRTGSRRRPSPTTPRSRSPRPRSASTVAPGRSSSPPICTNTATARIAPWSGNPPATPTAPISLWKEPRRRRLRGDDGRAPVRAELRGGPQERQGRCLQPLLDPHRPRRRPAGAEGRGRDAAAGGDRQARRHPGTASSRGGARGRRGESHTAERTASSCPARVVGAASIAAGTGPAPLHSDGKVFLSGPYHGRAVRSRHGRGEGGAVPRSGNGAAGPRRLGSRARHIRGSQARIRSADIKVDRPNFTLNPTGCGLLATGVLKGGGATGGVQLLRGQRPLPDHGIGALGFRPKLTTRLFGGRKSDQNAPSIRNSAPS